MRIKEILWQSRNDFHAIMECELCNAEQTNNAGYDDYNYHKHVIPSMKCNSCQKSTRDAEVPHD